MRNEHQLNSYITTVLKMKGDYMYLKTSEKYMAGVSDFLVWHKGVGLALEVKLTKKRILHKEDSKGKLLPHPFSSKQRSFLEGFSRIGGGKAYGLVGLADIKKLYLVKWDEIPESGNWATNAFLEKYGESSFNIHDVGDVISTIYGRQV